MYIGENDDAAVEINQRKDSLSEDIYPKLFYDVDYSLFRDDIDPKRAVDVIVFTMEGYAAREVSPDKTLEDYESEYDRFLKEVDEYSSLLRRCFYK